MNQFFGHIQKPLAKLSVHKPAIKSFLHEHPIFKVRSTSVVVFFCGDHWPQSLHFTKTYTPGCDDPFLPILPPWWWKSRESNRRRKLGWHNPSRDLAVFDTQDTQSSRLEKYELIKKWFEFSVFSISGLKERVGENHVLVKQLLSAIGFGWFPSKNPFNSEKHGEKHCKRKCVQKLWTAHWNLNDAWFSDNTNPQIDWRFRK